MKKSCFTIALLCLAGAGSLNAQQTVLTVHQHEGSQTEAILGPTGGIYFQADGNQFTVKDFEGLSETFLAENVALMTFAEKAVSDDTTESIAPVVAPRLSLYPNPATDQVRVSGIGAGTQRVELYSMAGALVRTVRLTEGGCLSLQGLPSGIYFVRCNEQTTKICKQ